MPGIFWCKTLSFKHMTKVTSTITAYNLGTYSICILLARNSAFNFIIKAGPPAMTVEFIFRPEQGSVAALANINSLLFVIYVFSGPRSFCSFLINYILLKCIQWIIIHRIFNYIDFQFTYGINILISCIFRFLCVCSRDKQQ